MTRLISIFLFTASFFFMAQAQSVFTSTINSYNESQKRLVAKNPGHFLYVVNQGQWDLDSCGLYACKTYGLNILSPYDEAINVGNLQRETDWLNQHQLKNILQFINHSKGEKKIALLLELALYYLHRPGSNPSHIDKATLYIEQAKVVAQNLKLRKWLLECDALTGELYFQQNQQEAQSC